MADFQPNVRALSAAAWRLRAASPRPCPLPFALTLFTDDRRQGDIEGLVAALPKAMGDFPPLAIVFRHDGLAAAKREALAHRVRMVVQAKGHYFLMARGGLPGADGIHAPRRMQDRLGHMVSIPTHSLGEGLTGAMKGADLCFLSPVFPTASHPGAASLGPARAAAMASQLPLPVFALGGMNEMTARRLHGGLFQGIGAIGAFNSSTTA